MGMLLRRYHKGDGKTSSDDVAIGENTASVDQTVSEKKKPGRKSKTDAEEKE